MKVLQIARAVHTTGGMEVFVRRISETLVESGHATAVAVGADAPTESLTYPTVRIRGLFEHSNQDRSRARRQLEETLRDFNPDIVVTHHSADGELLQWLNDRARVVEIVHGFVCAGAKLFRRRDTVCMHPVGSRCLWDWYVGPCGSGASPADAATSLLRAKGHLQALRRLPKVIVGSLFMKSYLVCEGVRADVVEIADFDMGISNREVRPLSNASFTSNILLVGRVVYAKGFQYAFRSLALLDDSFRVTVVGEGWYEEQLRKLSVQLGIAERVRFKGALTGDALKAEYDAARVVVIPSVWPEPVGLVVPEACAVGKPVIAFDSGGLKEWAEKYPQVHIVERADVGALARAIVHVTNTAATDRDSFVVRRRTSLVEILEREYSAPAPSKLPSVSTSASPDTHSSVGESN